MSDFPQIPGYKITKILGKGGMGIVYLAVQESLNRQVALKVTLPSLYDKDKTFLDRFVREARSAAMIQHPNVVTVFDAGVFENSSFMAMEYVPTGTLKDVNKDDLTHNQICRLFIGIAQGLGVAHKADLVHRDIKPDNILIDNEGNPLVTDFGIVKTLKESNSALTRVGDTVGTPQYMSPEQIKAETIDGRSDIYSLGIVLYNFLEGHVPFADTTPTAIYIKHVTEEPALLSKKNEAFQLIMIKALQKAPENRFSSTKELITALNALMILPHTPPPKSPFKQNDFSTARTKMVPPVMEIPIENGNRLKIIIAVGSLILLIGSYILYGVMSSPDSDKKSKQAVQNLSEEKNDKFVTEKIEAPQKQKNKEVSINENPKDAQGSNLSNSSAEGKQTNERVYSLSEKDGFEVSSVNVQAIGLATETETVDLDTATLVEPDLEEQMAEQAIEVTQAHGLDQINTQDNLPEEKVDKLPVEEQISQLLLSANQDYAKLRLLRPTDNNAYIKYSKILQLDSVNKEAKIGLLNIMKKYVFLMQAKINKNKFGEAQKHISNAIKIREYYNKNDFGVGTSFWQDSGVTLVKLKKEENKIAIRIQKIEEQKRLAQQPTIQEPVVEKPDYELTYQEGLSYLSQEQYTSAKEKFEQVAANGHAPSENELGEIFLKARGVKKDYVKAFEWFSKAAKKDFAPAQDNLGLMHFKGYGTKRNFDESFFWYSKAANQGYSDSQGILGALYEYGRGVKKSSYKAVQWYKKAAKQGNKFAIKKLRKRGISKFD